MKNIIFILSVALLLSLLIISCNSNGNTGNGANDPTSKFEPNNIKDPEDVRLQQGTDSTNATSADTTVKENGH